MGVFSDMFNAVAVVMEGEEVGLVKSPHMLNPRVTPSTGTNRMYSLDIQTVNTGDFRDARHMRLAHTLTVTFVTKLQPNNVPASQREGLDTEAVILVGMMDQAKLATYGVEYVSTKRTINPAGELLYTQMVFALHQSISIVAD